MTTSGLLRNGGFSLIETLIAILVLAVGLAAVARFQGTLLQDSSLAKERSEAVQLAQEKLEQLRSYRQIDSSATEFDFGDIVSSTTNDSIAGKSASFTRSWTVTNTQQTVASGTYTYKTVIVTVTWSRAGTSQADTTVRLTTIISNADPKFSGALS